MPEPRDFFSTNVIYQVVVFLFSTIIGAAGLQQMMAPRYFIALIIASLILSGISWLISARQSAVARRSERNADELQASIREILALAAPGTSVAALEGLPPNALRTRVADITKELRDLDNRLHESIFPGGTDPSKTREERKAIWYADIDRQHRQRDAIRHEFISRLHAPALALRDEMRRRLGIPAQTPPVDTVVALDLAMLAGSHPLHEAALALEALARQLPE